MRKLLCFVLTLVACVLLTTAVSAETVVPTTCEACGGAEVEWVALTASNKWYNLDEGHYHYYLAGNDTTYRYTPNPTETTVTSTNSCNPVTICLDLNGYHISTAGRALGLYNGCTLNIMDSSEAQTGYVEGGHGTNNLVGGTIFSYGELNLYSGTLRYSNAGTKENKCYAGGVISMGGSYEDAVFNMYGGRIEGGGLTAVSGKTCCGGAIYAGKGKINLYDGEITSGSVQEGYYGPCIYLYSTIQLTLSGDANVENIYVNGSSAKVNIDGTYAGKSRLTYANSISLSNSKVIGTATNTPSITGDLFCTNGDGWLVNVSGSNVQLATFTPSGTRHYCQHCKEVVKWTAISTSNYAKPKTVPGEYHYYLSGNFGSYLQLCKGAEVCLDLYGNSYTRAGRSLLANGGSTLNLMDTVGGGSVCSSHGTDNERGGTITASGTATMNMYSGTVKFTPGTNAAKAKRGVVAIGGTLNLYGGKIEGGDLTGLSASTGGAVFLYTSNSVNGVLNAYGGEITSGTVNSVGPCVYASVTGSSVKLAGDAKVEDIYFISNNQKLTVSGTYTGTANVTYGTAPAFGDTVGVSDDATISGKITCSNGQWLITPDGEKLVISLDAKVVVVNGSKETGYDSLLAAIDACETGYIKLLHPLTENVTVTKDLSMDLNGNTVTGTVAVAEGKTLFVKDSQTDDYTVADTEGYGKLTVSGNVAAQEGYLMINEDGALSFHKLTVAITDMTLRSEKAGLYYKSSFLGDELVAGKVESFGVALNVRETPSETNMDTTSKHTTFTTFESGKNGNASSSTVLSGILKEKNSLATNKRNLNVLVYGRPYVKTADGYIFGASVSRDLAQQLEDVDDLFDSLTGNQRNPLLTMYETFQSALAELTLPNILEEKTMNDKTLKLLMVGNSFCYYYVEELYGLLMANPDPNRGYENVEIYNLYYSGCKLNQHYEWWINDTAKYDLYKTDASGRIKQTSPTTGAVWTLEETLQQGRWDYISLQGMSNEVNYGSGNVADNGQAISQYATPLLNHFHQLHPYARLLWHRTWAFEVGRISNGTAYTVESLAAYDAGMQAACDWMCNEFDKDKDYDLVMVNSGATWTIAREENAKLETSLIPVEGGLCARKGVRNETTFPYYTGNANAGDGYHDGDIGGGQFLNACAWYETITGQDVRDNTYKPTTTKGTYEVSGKYELSDAFAELLRNAAHTALNP